jgi:hypothetical protein
MGTKVVKEEMTLSKAFEALENLTIDHHDSKMALIEIMCKLANSQFKSGIETAEEIWVKRLNESNNN